MSFDLPFGEDLREIATSSVVLSVNTDSSIHEADDDSFDIAPLETGEFGAIDSVSAAAVGSVVEIPLTRKRKGVSRFADTHTISSVQEAENAALRGSVSVLADKETPASDGPPTKKKSRKSASVDPKTHLNALRFKNLRTSDDSWCTYFTPLERTLTGSSATIVGFLPVAVAVYSAKALFGKLANNPTLCATVDVALAHSCANREDVDTMWRWVDHFAWDTRRDEYAKLIGEPTEVRIVNLFVELDVRSMGEFEKPNSSTVAYPMRVSACDASLSKKPGLAARLYSASVVPTQFSRRLVFKTAVPMLDVEVAHTAFRGGACMSAFAIRRNCAVALVARNLGSNGAPVVNGRSRDACAFLGGEKLTAACPIDAASLLVNGVCVRMLPGRVNLVGTVGQPAVSKMACALMRQLTRRAASMLKPIVSQKTLESFAASAGVTITHECLAREKQLQFEVCRNASPSTLMWNRQWSEAHGSPVLADTQFARMLFAINAHGTAKDRRSLMDQVEVSSLYISKPNDARRRKIPLKQTAELQFAKRARMLQDGVTRISLPSAGHFTAAVVERSDTLPLAFWRTVETTGLLTMAYYYHVVDALEGFNWFTEDGRILTCVMFERCPTSALTVRDEYNDFVRNAYRGPSVANVLIGETLGVGANRSTSQRMLMRIGAQQLVYQIDVGGNDGDRVVQPGDWAQFIGSNASRVKARARLLLEVVRIARELQFHVRDGKDAFLPFNVRDYVFAGDALDFGLFYPHHPFSPLAILSGATKTDIMLARTVDVTRASAVVDSFTGTNVFPAGVHVICTTTHIGAAKSACVFLNDRERQSRTVVTSAAAVVANKDELIAALESGRSNFANFADIATELQIDDTLLVLGAENLSVRDIYELLRVMLRNRTGVAKLVLIGCFTDGIMLDKKSPAISSLMHSVAIDSVVVVKSESRIASSVSASRVALPFAVTLVDTLEESLRTALSPESVNTLEARPTIRYNVDAEMFVVATVRVPFRLCKNVSDGVQNAVVANQTRNTFSFAPGEETTGTSDLRRREAVQSNIFFVDTSKLKPERVKGGADMGIILDCTPEVTITRYRALGAEEVVAGERLVPTSSAEAPLVNPRLEFFSHAWTAAETQRILGSSDVNRRRVFSSAELGSSTIQGQRIEQHLWIKATENSTIRSSLASNRFSFDAESLAKAFHEMHARDTGSSSADLELALEIFIWKRRRRHMYGASHAVLSALTGNAVRDDITLVADARMLLDRFSAVALGDPRSRTPLEISLIEKHGPSAVTVAFSSLTRTRDVLPYLHGSYKQMVKLARFKERKAASRGYLHYTLAARPITSALCAPPESAFVLPDAPTSTDSDAVDGSADPTEDCLVADGGGVVPPEHSVASDDFDISAEDCHAQERTEHDDDDDDDDDTAKASDRSSGSGQWALAVDQ